MREDFLLQLFPFRIAKCYLRDLMIQLSVTSISIFGFAIAPISTARAADSVLLNTYVCSEFLSDIVEPTDGGKLLRSMMMISWAAGYAAAHQPGLPKADAEALRLIASSLGEGCRKTPGDTAVNVISKAISSIVQNKIAPPAASATSTAPGFSGHENYDVYGGDLRKIPKIDISACASACRSDLHCRGYSFDRWNQFCILKSTISALSFDPSSSTGIRTGIAEPERSKAAIRMERRTSKVFEGSNSRRSNISRVEDCENDCMADETCAGFTFGKSQNICRAFSMISTFKPDPDATSGFKTQNPP